MIRDRGTGLGPPMDDADSYRDFSGAYPRGDSRRGGCQTPLPSPTLRSMNRHADVKTHLSGTPGHLRHLGIEMVEFQTSEEDS